WKSLVEQQARPEVKSKWRTFRPRREASKESKLLRGLGYALRLALWPVWKLLFDWIPGLLRRNAGVGRGNWPEPNIAGIWWFVGGLVHRTLQMTGYGLVKTFLQGPAAPLWAGEAADDHVVRLPVPPEITTLAVPTDGDAFEQALEAARAATRAELRRVKFPS